MSTDTARREAMTAARPPVGTGSSPLFGLLLALALIALGVVGVQEALVRSGASSRTSWTSSALAWLDGVRSADWMLAVFAAAVLAGVLLLLVVLRRRPRKTLSLRAGTGVFLRTRDLSRLAESLVDGTAGVIDVNASATRRRLRVSVTTVEPEEHNATLTDIVRERLAPCLDALAQAPRATVSIRNEDLT